MARTATNPTTGEKLIFINNQWVPIERTATNPDTGARAYFASNIWTVDDAPQPQEPLPQEPLPQEPTPDVQEDTSLFGKVSDFYQSVSPVNLLNKAALYKAQNLDTVGESKSGFGMGLGNIALIPETLNLQFQSSSIGTNQRYLEAMRAIDNGASPTEAAAMFPGKVELPFLTQYAEADSDKKAKLVQNNVKGIEESLNKIEELYPELTKKRQELAEKYPAKVENLTDIRNPVDALNWLSYNVGAALPQLAPTVGAAYLTGPVGALAVSAPLGLQETINNRTAFLADKLQGMSTEEQAKYISDYLDESKDVTYAVGAVVGLLDLAGGPTKTVLRNQILKRIGKDFGEDTVQSFQTELGKQIGKEVLEEFVTGGAQSATQLVGQKTLGEIEKLVTGENLKQILNDAAAEAAGALGGSPISAVSTYNTWKQRTEQIAKQKIAALVNAETDGQLQLFPELGRQQLAGLPVPETPTERPSAEVQPDMLDISEEAQIQDMLEADRAEEAAQALATRGIDEEQATTERETAAQFEALNLPPTTTPDEELQNIQERIETTRAAETKAKRQPILDKVMENLSISTIEDSVAAVSAELRRQGFRDTNVSESELEQLTKSVADKKDRAKSTATLESLIPEEGARAAAREAQLKQRRTQPAPTPTPPPTAELAQPQQPAPIEPAQPQQPAPTEPAQPTAPTQKLSGLGEVIRQQKALEEAEKATTPTEPKATKPAASTTPTTRTVKKATALQDSEITNPDVQKILKAKNAKVNDRNQYSALQAFKQFITGTFQPTSQEKKAKQPSGFDLPALRGSARTQGVAKTLDIALRDMAVASVTPLDPNLLKIKKLNDVAKAGISWVRKNLSEEINNKLDAYIEEAQEFIARAEALDAKRVEDETPDVSVWEGAPTGSGSRMATNMPLRAYQLSDFQDLRGFYNQEKAEAGEVTTVPVDATETRIKQIRKTRDELVKTAKTEDSIDGNVADIIEGTDEDFNTITLDDIGLDLDGRNSLEELLIKDAVAATMPMVSEAVSDHVLDGNFRLALDQFANDTSNKQLARIARLLANKLNKNVKVEFVDTPITDRKGRPAVASFNGNTNTIQFDLNEPLSSHALLHEAFHAVTFDTLSNPSHPVTKQLRSIFNDLRGAIQGAYGLESVSDFANEIFINDTFKADLASTKSKTGNLTLWEKVIKAFKKLLGLDSGTNKKAVETATELVNTLLATQPNARNATTIRQDIWRANELTDADMEKALKPLLGGYKFLPPADLKRMWNSLKNASAKVRAFTINGIGLEAIVDMAKDTLPAAATLQKVLLAIDGTRNELMTKFQTFKTDMYKAFRADIKALEILSELVSISTMNEVDALDPTKSEKYYSSYIVRYGTKDRQIREKLFATAEKANRAAERLRRVRKKASEEGKPSIVEAVQVVRPSKNRLDAYKEATKLKNKLTPAQRGVFVTMRDEYVKIDKAIKKAEDDNIDKIDADANLKNTVRDILFRQRLEAGSISPYFPAFREGDFWVSFVYKDEANRTQAGYMAFKSEAEQQAAVDRLNEADWVESAEALDEAAIRKDINTGKISIELLNKLQTQVKKALKDAGVDPASESAQEINEFVTDLILRSLPEQSVIQSRKARKGLAGFEGDPLYVYSKKMPQLINAYANIQNRVDLSKAAREVMDQSRGKDRLTQEIAISLAGSQEQTNKRLGKLRSYVEFAKNPYLNPTIRLLRAAAFIGNLGFNVSSVAVNTMIMPIIVWARLSSKYGVVRATRLMTTSLIQYMGTAGRVYREGTRAVDENGKPLSSQDIIKRELGGFSLTNDETVMNNDYYKPFKPLIKLMKQYGFDTRTIAQETAEIDAVSSQFLNKLLYASAFVFNHSERAIRQGTLMAFYRAELEQRTGKSYGQLTDADIAKHGDEAAMIAVQETLWTNTSPLLTTAPRFAQSGLTALLMQFQRVPAMILYGQLRAIKSVGTLLRNSAKTAAQREEAKMLTKFLVYQTLAGYTFLGVKGIPFYGVAVALANQILLGEDDDEDDADTLVRKALGEFWYYGLIAYLTGADITDRAGVTNLLIRDRRNFRGEATGWDTFEAAGGASASLIRDVYDLINNTVEAQKGPPVTGKYDEVIRKIPLRAVSNIIQGYGLLHDKEYRTRRGDLITDISTRDALLKAFGFNPVTMREGIDKLNLNYRKIEGAEAKKQLLQDWWNEARNDLDDPKVLPDVKADIQEYLDNEWMELIRDYNTKHPENQITAKGLAQSRRERLRRSAVAERTGGLPVDRKYIQQILESNAEFDEDL